MESLGTRRRPFIITPFHAPRPAPQARVHAAVAACPAATSPPPRDSLRKRVDSLLDSLARQALTVAHRTRQARLTSQSWASPVIRSTSAG